MMNILLICAIAVLDEKLIYKFVMNLKYLLDTNIFSAAMRPNPDRPHESRMNIFPGLRHSGHSNV